MEVHSMTPQVGDIWCFRDKMNYLLMERHDHDSFTALDLTMGKTYRIMLDYSNAKTWRFVA
jgi:hypothetical protein